MTPGMEGRHHRAWGLTRTRGRRPARGRAHRDDGIGGADPSRGSGLISLTDRVEALGGTIDIYSHAGAGMRILAEFPASDS